ncbi:MAG: hypothetical protein ACTSWX_10890 [Promethearchaeota archaeon]
MNIFDWELELEHVIYMFIGALTWLGLSFWSHFALKVLYADAIPVPIVSFIHVCYWIGGGGILFGIIILIISSSE